MPPRKHHAATNGYASIGPIKTLERIAEFHEAKARNARGAIDLLVEHHAGKRRTTDAMLDDAIAIDHKRRDAAAPRKQYGPGVKDRREQSIAILAEYDTTTPRPARGPKISSLIQHGYLKAKGDGYIRTAKPFHP